MFDNPFGFGGGGPVGRTLDFMIYNEVMNKKDARDKAAAKKDTEREDEAAEDLTEEEEDEEYDEAEDGGEDPDKR